MEHIALVSQYNTNATGFAITPWWLDQPCQKYIDLAPRETIMYLSLAVMKYHALLLYTLCSLLYIVIPPALHDLRSTFSFIQSKYTVVDGIRTAIVAFGMWTKESDPMQGLSTTRFKIHQRLGWFWITVPPIQNTLYCSTDSSDLAGNNSKCDLSRILHSDISEHVAIRQECLTTETILHEDWASMKWGLYAK